MLNVVQVYRLVKKFVLIGFWIFQYCFNINSLTLYYCGTCFLIPSGCQSGWLQIRPNNLLGLIWVQTVCKGYQQMTKVAASGQRVKCRITCWLNQFHLVLTFFVLLKCWLQQILSQGAPTASTAGMLYSKHMIHVSCHNLQKQYTNLI